MRRVKCIAFGCPKTALRVKCNAFLPKNGVDGNVCSLLQPQRVNCVTCGRPRTVPGVKCVTFGCHITVLTEFVLHLAAQKMC